MGVQAGAARRVMSRSPEEAAVVLSSIEESSRQAVAEMHRLLGFLRREDDDGAQLNGRAAAPQPGLARLDELAESLRRAGLTVTVDVAAIDGPVPASIDLSAYRIVQEALTNALKYAGPARACVVVHFAPGSLTLEIDDDGVGSSATGNGGHGLVGMRERVAVFGGDVEAGPKRGGGYRVTARLPLEAGS
jgi:signal transduction histidine kinase